MAVCLGESYERFSVRLLTYPILSDDSKQKYIDEYAEIGKKDEETGQITRFIVSSDEAFGLEVTLKDGFNHGYYDGVMIKLTDVHSGAMFWQKKYPKSSAKEPSQKDKKIIIDSIDCATIGGRLRSNVHMRLAPLVPEDFMIPGVKPIRKYPHMLEGLRIEVCKYKGAGDIQLTKDEFDLRVQEHALKLENYAQQNEHRDSLDTLKRAVIIRSFYQKHKITHKLRLVDGIVVPEEEIEKYLVPPTQYKQLFKYGNTQIFKYLWREKKFFDTTAIAQTPIAPIRQSWDLLSHKERELAYGELSKYDFQQIWSHHYKALGPKPKKADTDALKSKLRKNLPDYWRSWNKLYAYEIPIAFKKLQERRRYLEKGEIPEDSEVIGKSEETAIDLESKPEKLKKPSRNIQFPSLTMGLARASRGSGLATPKAKPVAALVIEPEVSPQAQLNRASEHMSSAILEPAQVQPTSGTKIVDYVAPPPGEFEPFNTKPFCIVSSLRLPSARAFILHCQAAHGRTVVGMDQAAVAGRIADSNDAKSPSPYRTFSNTSPGEPPCPRATETLSTIRNTIATPSLLDTTAQVASNVPQSKCPEAREGSNNCVDASAPINPCSHQEYVPGAASPPTIKSKPTSRVPKRPAEFTDLPRPKKPCQAMKTDIKAASRIKAKQAFNEFVTKMRPMSPSASASLNIKSEPSISTAQPPADPMDIDIPQKTSPTDSSTSYSSSTGSSINSLHTMLSRLSQPIAPSTLAKVESEPSQTVINTAVAEPVHMTGILPEVVSLKPEPSSMDVSNTESLPGFAASERISASNSSKVKTEESKTTPKLAAEAMEAPVEFAATPLLKSDVPSKFEQAHSPAANLTFTNIKTSEPSCISIIDLDTWFPSPAFTATYLSTTTPVPMLKSEAYPDKKQNLNLNGGTKDLNAELKILEEEAQRKEIELKDAMRVAEVRKEMNGMRRRIEQLRLAKLRMGGN